MNDILKKTVVLLLAVIAAFSFIACGEQPDVPDTETPDLGTNSISVDGGASKSVELTLDISGSASVQIHITLTYKDNAEQGIDISYTKDGNAVMEGISLSESGTVTATSGGVYVITVKMKADSTKLVIVTVTVNAYVPSQDNESYRELTTPVKPMKNGVAEFSTYGDYTQHDPSIFWDDTTQKYYTLGTDATQMLASTDLMTWTATANAYITPAKAAEVKAWVGGNMNIWAPDLTKIGNIYYLYYSLTASFGSSRSAIGLATASSVTGPYTDQGIVVNGVATPSGAGVPNCIDPNVIKTPDGKLYLSYGSFGKGIYILELDPTTGKSMQPAGYDAGYYGKNIAGGLGMEGPYIAYNPETEYYYLFVSVIADPDKYSPSANLYRTYNVRAGRSTKVDGPYLDSKGNDMLTLTNDKGDKVIGGYTFEADADEIERGWKAPGGNSVINRDGTWYLVNHVRRESDNNESNSSAPDNPVNGPSYQEVRRMYFNEDGWPVVSPNKYGGETVQTVGSQNLVGEWKVIKLIKEQPTCIHSQKASFAADKTISGAYTGTFRITGDYAVRIVLTENEVEKTYKGVVTLNWDYVNKKPVLSFMAVNEDGISLWGNRYLA
jgi:arabinan endo-1,5-alpha-L-arabinosidase